MKILDMEEFLIEAGGRLPHRDMSAYEGKPFDCACGQKHDFQSSYMDYRNFATNGANAKMIIVCPNNSNISTLVKTKYKFVVVFDRFESIAGNKG